MRVAQLTAQEVEDLDFARLALAIGQAQLIRESSGLSRPEFVAASGNTFTVAALRAWEGKLRRPRGNQGAAYGRTLRGRMAVAADPVRARTTCGS